jgi:hypothetical protein
VRLGARLLLLLVGLLLPLLLLEAALRLVGPILPGNYNTGTFLTTHPVYGRFHVPNFDGWVKTSEFTSRVTINSLGLRGPERPYAKPPGATRVLVLGDSFVEAAQVHEAEGVVGQLEAVLTARGGGPVEVLNAGVGGWGQHQQYVFLREEGVRYEPDLVLVHLYLGNDVYDSSWVLQGRPRTVREPYFVFEDDGTFRQLEFRSRRPEEVAPAVALLRERTMLWNVFETGVLQKLGPGDEDDDVRANRFNYNKVVIHELRSSERQQEAWRVTLALLDRIRRLGEERGFRTMLVVAPALYQVDDRDWAELLRANRLKEESWSADLPNRVLAERAAEHGMPMLDLLPAFRAEHARGGPPLYFAQDRHWTPAGHALAAREIAQSVEREVAR